MAGGKGTEQLSRTVTAPLPSQNAAQRRVPPPFNKKCEVGEAVASSSFLCPLPVPLPLGPLKGREELHSGLESCRRAGPSPGAGVTGWAAARDSAPGRGGPRTAGPRTAGPVVPRGRFRAGGGRLGGDAAMLRTLSGLGALPRCRAPALLLLPARGRKTRHDPPAKSKVGRVKTPPAVDPAEFFVLTERYRQYRQTVRALRLEFVSEVRKKVHEARAGVLAERRAQEDATEHRQLMAWNQAENRRLHELRLARLRLEAQEQEQRQAEERARRDREEQAWMQLKQQEVLRLQEEAKNFITRENLEARVEEALDSPKDYNWAITKEGLVVRPQHRGS